MTDVPNPPSQNPTPNNAPGSTPGGTPGTPAPGTPAPGTPLPYATPTDATIMGDPADVEKNKVYAVLAYIGLLFLVPLLAAKDSPFARYHANQGVILFLAALVSGFVAGIVSFVGGFVPVLGVCIVCVVPLAFMAAIVTFAVMGILNAVAGKMKPLPLIGGFTLIK